MNRADKVFSVLVLTEDSSRHAPATVEHITRRLFRHLDERCETHRINFEPPDNEAREMFTANAWVEHRRDRVRVHNYIAQKLHNDRGFVVHHVDADQTWTQYTKHGPRPQVTRLERLLLDPVRKILLATYRDHDSAASDAERSARVEARITRFFRLIPCWEIEAWLYQNTERAKTFCKRRPGCRCDALLADWGADRTAPDEVEHVSDQLCFGKEHNAELAHGLPVAEVHAAGKSLAAALDAMLGCDALLDAIQRTYVSATEGAATA